MTHRILFVGVDNSCRSQMAEAFARQHGLEADSAGTTPAHELSLGAVVAMKEKGLDISKQKPKALDFLQLGNYERIICMGVGVHRTSPDLHGSEDWEIDNPNNLPLAVMRTIRDEIEAKVKELAAEIQEWSAPRPDLA